MNQSNLSSFFKVPSSKQQEETPKKQKDPGTKVERKKSVEKSATNPKQSQAEATSRHFSAKSAATTASQKSFNSDVVTIDSDSEPESSKLAKAPPKQTPVKKSTSASTAKSKPVIKDSDEEMKDLPKKTSIKRRVPDSDAEQPAKKTAKSADAKPKPTPVPRKIKATEPEEDTKPNPMPKPKAKPARKSKVAEEDFVVPDDEAKPKKAAPKKAPAKPKQAKSEDQEDSKPVKRGPPVWMKSRAGPSAPGSKPIPNGAPNCLGGLTIVFTGELQSLSREEATDLAKRYGARVTGAPSSKTTYVVLGDDAGPKKVEIIKRLNIKTLDEDGFLALIGDSPGGEDDPKYLEAQKKEANRIKQSAKALDDSISDSDNKQELWTTKYAPKKLSDICGNKSNVEKLYHWLENWQKSYASDFKKPGPDGLGAYRCILISGPPGIGKTTAAHLVANDLGFNILELNASDTRSKKLLETAFKVTIENTTIKGMFKVAGSLQTEANLEVNNRSVIIMDEVDGMSAGDRGGVGALNALIRKTKIPIIAICNDKSTPKMKPLTNTCFSMTFRRPTSNEMRSRLMAIAYKEGITLEAQVMDQLVAGTQSDIRQILNMLSSWKLGADALDFDQGKKLVKLNEKNAIQTPWSLYSKLFSSQTFGQTSNMTLNDKLDLYFQDFSMMPLFVQDNYLKGKFSKASGAGSGSFLDAKNLELASKAADSISDGDLVDRLIHTSQEWSLLPTHGMFSCVRPASFCYGGGGGFPTFPTWFGKNSTQQKLGRNLGDIQMRMRMKITGDRKEVRQSYVPALYQQLVVPLQDEGQDAIERVIHKMDEYFLSKDEWETLVELGVGAHNGDGALKKIAPPVKAAFTRMYNKGSHPVAFHRDLAAGKRVRGGGTAMTADFEDAYLDDMQEEPEAEVEESDDDGLGGDKLIKAVAKGKTKTKTKATKTKK